MENDLIKVTPRCPIRTTLELVGGKWKLLIIIQLATEPKRLSKLKRDIPDISEKMLIQELKNLVDSELVIRTNYGEVPPKVEYKLSDKGKLALPLIGHMKEFAEQYLAQ
ncbi:helix-turn-helix domain-containing protein [Marivirga harenae]|uniref:winged helix-turn-helix transcriptional regulator n=1 Tax=Marivirga harenae TaxID=2010992 RepID=UPI0026DF1B39|nr:helix-turn-helix domain-containing protein [Marivirga harenae]WKV12504.1 helix-turn-helix domain-containing protein [Marivirga harenae]|tara:strand:- start:14345 stop:14671 length:327 start_codon:yes stop_codon:yes gene_type:complete